MDHPSEETLKRFAEGTTSREENRSVVAHLLKGCSVCAGRLRALLEPESVPRSDYEPALDRFDQGLIENLESSISPIQTLRTVLRGVFPAPPGEEGKRKKR
jgi:hypothetical protein